MRRNKKNPVLTAVVFIYIGVILAAPLAALLFQSARLGPSSLLDALCEGDALHSLGITAAVTAIAIAVNSVFGSLAGIVIARQKFFGRRFVDALIEMPLALSPVMIGLAFILLFGRDGWLTEAAEWLDIKIIFSFWGLVAATVFVTLPFIPREVAGVLREIGTAEEEAAVTLGANAWQRLRYVTLPNIRGALSCGITLTAARSFGEFGAVLILGGAISGKTQTATTYIYAAMEERHPAGAYGMSLVLALLSVGLLLLLGKLKQQQQEA
jgi:sulfate/thiosulfate transport system permease protein